MVHALNCDQDFTAGAHMCATLPWDPELGHPMQHRWFFYSHVLIFGHSITDNSCNCARLLHMSCLG